MFFSKQLSREIAEQASAKVAKKQQLSGSDSDAATAEPDRQGKREEEQEGNRVDAVNAAVLETTDAPVTSPVPRPRPTLPSVSKEEENSKICSENEDVEKGKLRIASPYIV